MNVRQLAILFAASLLPLIFYLIHPNIIGVDGYAFLNHVCLNNPLPDATMPLAQIIFGIIPCNLTAIKIMLWGCLFASSLIVAKMGELIHKNGWLAGILIYLSPLFINNLLKLEDDTLAYPILLLSQFLFLKGIVEKKKKYQASAVGLVLIAGVIWKGSVYYLFSYAVFPIGMALSIIAIIYFNKNLIGSILPNLNVIENFPIVGLFYSYFLLIGLKGIKKSFLPQTIFWIAFTLLNAKFVVHLLPYLAIGTLTVYNNLISFKQQFLIAIAIAMLIGASFAITTKSPTAQELDLLQEAKAYSQYTGKPIVNDWTVGYWIEHIEGTPSHKGGGDPVTDFNNSIAVNWYDLNCDLLREEKNWKLFNC